MASFSEGVIWLTFKQKHFNYLKSFHIGQAYKPPVVFDKSIIFSAR